VITERRFKGFDEDDDKEIIKRVIISDDEPSKTSDIADGDTPMQSIEQTQTAESRKRQAEDQGNEKNLDDILPAAAAMKRRKLKEQGEHGIQDEEAITPEKRKGKATEAYEKYRRAQKKKGKEIDVEAALQANREAREEEARREAEAQHVDLEQGEISRLRDLAIVEEMEVKPRTDKPVRGSPETSATWDERWNGRKNFKKFRKHGNADTARRGHKVFVALEPVKKKEYGLSDEYWFESDQHNSKESGKDSGRVTENETQERAHEARSFMSRRTESQAQVQSRNPSQHLTAQGNPSGDQIRSVDNFPEVEQDSVSFRSRRSRRGLTPSQEPNRTQVKNSAAEVDQYSEELRIVPESVELEDTQTHSITQDQSHSKRTLRSTRRNPIDLTIEESINTEASTVKETQNTNATAGKKRALADTAIEGGPLMKRTRASTTVNIDDDGDDATAFRFKRRGRG
jgi:hypothetical protein